MGGAPRECLLGEVILMPCVQEAPSKEGRSNFARENARKARIGEKASKIYY